MRILKKGERNKRRYAKKESPTPIITKSDSPVCTSYCFKCIYYAISTHTCDYIFATGKIRGCPPGDDCAKRKVMEKARKQAAPKLETKEKKRRKRHTYNSFPEDRQAKLVQMYHFGASDYEIAKALGITRDSARYWRMKLCSSKEGEHEPENVRAIQEEACFKA